jgi:hypothetical protein
MGVPHDLGVSAALDARHDAGYAAASYGQCHWQWRCQAGVTGQRGW